MLSKLLKNGIEAQKIQLRLGFISKRAFSREIVVFNGNKVKENSTSSHVWGLIECHACLGICGA